MTKPPYPLIPSSPKRGDEPFNGKLEATLSAKIIQRAINSLRRNPKNARIHSKKQVRQIVDSIRAFGFISAILIDEHGFILAGHGRWEAAMSIGMTEIPVIVVDHLTDAEKRLFAIADNKIALNAGWNEDLLAIEAGELSVAFSEHEVGFHFEITGFSPGEIDRMLTNHESDERDPADVFEPEAGSPVSSRGDKWLLGGNHQILCGDAQSTDDMARLNGGASIGLVITDPPYNVPVQGHVGGRGQVKHDEFAFASGEMTDLEFEHFLFVTIGLMISCCRLGALVYVFMDWRRIEILLKACRRLGLDLRNICVWNKTTPGQGSFYRSAHELIAVCQIPGGKAINNIELGKHGRNRSNVWNFPGVNNFRTGESDERSIHPTVKPVAMIAEAIKDASRRGDVVLDPFLGSGTTLLACEKVGRVCHGLEYEPRYVDTAIRRWQDFTAGDAILIATGSSSPSAQPTRKSASLVGLTFEEVARIRSKGAASSAKEASS
jgi:DNA modification methylase